MEQNEFRVLIKHYFFKGKTGTETKAKLDKHYGESAPSIRTIYRWYNSFRLGRLNTSDAERSGRPIEVSTPETIQKIRDMMSKDRRLKVREVAEAVGISNDRVLNIFNEHLQVRKLLVCWVPRLLTVEQKNERVTASKHGLDLFRINPEEFLHRYVTVDETWIRYRQPEAKQLDESLESPPKKLKTTPALGKIVATVFWDSHGVIFMDFFKKDSSLSGEYYSSLLDRLQEEITVKRPHLKQRKIIFHQDNAPTHSSEILTAKLLDLNYEILHNPPLSPDLAPSDYYMYTNFKKSLIGKRFKSESEVMHDSIAFFMSLDKSHLTDAVRELENRWTKCIELEGDYIEK